MVSKSMITCFCFHAQDSTDETPEQEHIRLNNVLAEYISANTLLMKENIQLKKGNNNLEQEIAHLKSEKASKEQLDPVSIKKEPTSDQGLKQLLIHKIHINMVFG